MLDDTIVVDEPGVQEVHDALKSVTRGCGLDYVSDPAYIYRGTVDGVQNSCRDVADMCTALEFNHHVNSAPKLCGCVAYQP